MAKPQKPSAAARTVDLFSGRTSLEDAFFQKPPSAEVDTSDVGEAKAEPETVEQIAERKRELAFTTSEYLSNRFSEAIDGGKFRVTIRGDLMLLETFRATEAGGAFAWSGVMFRKSDLKAITETLVAAWRAERGG